MLPIIIRRRIDGANGTNWPGVVILDPDAPMPAATLAQEVWESRWKLNPANLLRRLTSDNTRRRMEIMGHEVEVQAAVLIYEADTDAIRSREARAMLAGYDGLFRGWTLDRLRAAMAGVSDDARVWVAGNASLLRRYR